MTVTRRRSLLAGAPLLLGCRTGIGMGIGTGQPGTGPSAQPAREPLLPHTPLAFPRDFGAHPAYKTEWWYVTGALVASPPPGRALPAGAFTATHGFQITFFRSRVDTAANSHSQFAVRQLVFAHAAVTDTATGRLLHDQRIARAGFGLADAATQDTHVHLRDWLLRRQAGPQGDHYLGEVNGRDFSLSLRLTPTQPVLVQGEAGLSRKGPAQASGYYTRPQLGVQGHLLLQGRQLAVTGRAWLDHEWSDDLLEREAVGWDWAGMNLDDGGALTVFRLRRADGSTLWAGGSWRAPRQAARIFKRDEVRMTPLRTWTSPATAGRYPTAWQLDTPAGRHEVRALSDTQELDSRQSTGNVYWEGLSLLLDAQGRRVGQGYLEMTGYVERLRL